MKPDDVSQEAWDAAGSAIAAAFAANSLGRKVSDVEVIARAIDAAKAEEREEIARMAEEMGKVAGEEALMVFADIIRGTPQ